MITFAALMTIYCVAMGAVFGRVDGGGIAKVSEWVERTLVMFSFVASCSVFAGLYSLTAYAGVLGIATGHGQYFLARVAKYIEPEKVDILVRLFFGLDPRSEDRFKKLKGISQDALSSSERAEIEKAMHDYGMSKLYWRCLFGMFVTGTLVGLPAAAVAVYFGHYLYALLFGMTGLAKSIAYAFGYEVFGNTESAEATNGGLRTLLCVAVVLLYFFAR